MKITIQNYKQLRPSFDLSKLPKEAVKPFETIDNDFVKFLELYTDSDPAWDDIRKGLDRHIKIVNKYLTANDVKKSKPQKKEVPASSRAKKTAAYQVIDERIINDNIIVVIQYNNETRSITLPSREMNAYNRNSPIDLQKLWNLAKSKSKGVEPKKPSTKNQKLTRTDIENKQKGIKLRIAKLKKQAFSTRGEYNNHIQKNVKPLQQELVKLSDIWGKTGSEKISKTDNKKPKTKQGQSSGQKGSKSGQVGSKKESPCDEAIENYLENKKDQREKASKKRQKNKVANAVDKETLNFYNAEFRLLRRFKNLVTKKGVASFRSIQLLYMAFQKHAVARKVRKSSDLAHLYSICNKKLTKLYNTVIENKNSANIKFADKDVLEQLEKLVANKKVDYAISLLNRVINLQGTAPEDAKVERLINSIDNAFKNGRVDERSRLYEDLKDSKKQLKKYLADKVETIPTEMYGLTGVKKKVATQVAAVPNKADLHNVVLELPEPVERVYVAPTNVNTTGLNAIEPTAEIPTFNEPQNTETPPNPTVNKVIEKVKEVVKVVKKIDQKSNGVLSTEDIMAMQFDTLEFQGKWKEFMQSPAKNMKVAILGKPKNGKTSGCMSFANQLTDFGNVLYNFADQGINKSTQDLWKLTGLAEKPNAYLSATRSLDDLEKLCATGNYDFVFIDMINTYIHRTGIKYFEFEDRFLKKFPNISFFLVFEATKTGNFKGDQGWTHLVDAIVTVEDYVLHNNGRYGVGEYVVWPEGLKKQNPKKYKEFFNDTETENQQLHTVELTA